MKLIIHGNNLLESRNFYFDIKNKTQSFDLLTGEKITFDTLFQLSEGSSLFEKEKTIFLENFFSLNKSSSLESKKIIEYVNSNKKLNLVIWESTELSKTTLNLIKDFQIKTFSIPSQLFIFLDSLKPGDGKKSISIFNSLIKNSEAELIWFMLIRQFRLLFSILSDSKDIDEVKRLAPWQYSKLKIQSNLFGEQKIKN
ncbi:MAG TPA: hypothetical protein VES68_03030, partial [Candidatus Sulfotelmatobacter sp.]|nr:hypothetical protein [Candidatus Sulfotelmatobacter sp.]